MPRLASKESYAKIWVIEVSMKKQRKRKINILAMGIVFSGMMRCLIFSDMVLVFSGMRRRLRKKSMIAMVSGANTPR